MAVRGSEEDLVRFDTARKVLARVNLLAESNALAIDIGGNLAKLLYLQPHGPGTRAPTLVIDRLRSGVAPSLSVHVPALSGTLHFFAFETRSVAELVSFMRAHWIDPPRAAGAAAAGSGSGPAGSAGGPRHEQGPTSIRATGGGSYKYGPLFRAELGVSLARLDEMTCAVAGLNFMLASVPGEVYSFVPPVPTDLTSQFRPGAPARLCVDVVPAAHNPFPYLLVNIGSGVSIVKVTGHGRFERISGSALGGGTFWGLARLLLNCSTFDDVIELTNRGNHANVDMLVGDIYGGAYASLNLDANVIAASFGKVTMAEDARPATSWTAARKRFFRAVFATVDLWIAFFLALPVIGTLLRLLGIQDPFSSKIANLALGQRFRPQDVAMALLRMVAYNIGQIAYLNARVHDLDRIYFGGNFIRNHPHTIADVAFAVDFWSQGKTKALFLKHDGYLGVVGAFIGGESESPAKHVTARSFDSVRASSGKRRAGRKASSGAKASAAKEAGKDNPASVVSAGDGQKPKQAANGVGRPENGNSDAAPETSSGASERSKAKTRSRKSRSRAAAHGTNGVHANGAHMGTAAEQSVAVKTAAVSGGSGSVENVSGKSGKRGDSGAAVDPEGEWIVVARGKRKTGEHDA